MKNRLKCFWVLVITVLAVSICDVNIVKAHDEYDTDVILNYDITANVNEDATVSLTYHIEWKVLESDENGPVDWVQIGIPNDDVIEYEALSDNIKKLEIDTIDGEFANVYFKKKYYKGDVISFDFKIVQDRMYMVEQEGIDYIDEDDEDDEEINNTVVQEEPDKQQLDTTEKNSENITETEELKGTATYFFTPGWFDEIEVEKLTIRWKNDKVEKWSPSCKNKDGYLVWTTSLSYGEQYDVEVVYNLDAYGFDLSYISYPDSNDYDWYEVNHETMYDDDFSDYGFSIMTFLLMVFVFVFSFAKGIANYNVDSGLEARTTTKITRTKITYYESCPNCGGTRAEGKDECAYCGTNMIKSKETIDSSNAVTEEDKDALLYRTNGTYRYGNDNNTFVKVHVVHVPVHRSNSGSGHSHHHSSCVHSSCACACASSCACACACAGGGRAGCSSKDFYKNAPKLEMIKKKTEE